MRIVRNQSPSTENYIVLEITQTLLAEMLGVRCATVTNALREFEKAGLVASGQRQIVVLDRKALVQASCECYQAVNAQYKRLLY